MPMKQSDVQRLFMKHKMMYRDYENASPESLSLWAIQDTHDELMLNYYLREEALAEAPLDDYNVKFTSEVKIK